MRSTIVILFVASILVFAGWPVFAQEIAPGIVPRPQSVTPSPGEFRLDRKTRVFATEAEGRQLASYLNSYLQAYLGFKLDIVTKKPKSNYIAFLPTSVAASHSNTNGFYALRIEPESVQMDGLGSGRFYALQSLLQLMPMSGEPIAIRAQKIVDRPQFRYRGMHLDVGRHFMPVEFVKKYIDLISQYKFNYLHWGLTQDQGWRVESRKYPKLTEVGSCRKETVVARNIRPYIGDGIPHCGYYTQDQVREILAYAKARYVTVIPEINVPGHSAAALAAYPQFGCKDNYEYKVQTSWGIFKEIYCPTELTFKFLEDVFGELMELFPDTPYIHIGGDEVPKDHWNESAFVQDLKKREGLKDDNEVQSYFTRRIEKFVNSKGKKIIGWDEILEGGLAPNATVMSWRGTKGSIDAAKAKHDVIMTPTSHAYLDYGQGDPAYEPTNQGYYLPLEKVYSFDPLPKELTADEQKYILGGQGNVWTEFMKTPQQVEYMVFPRALAMSEVLWSKPENKNFADFLDRLPYQLSRLDKQNVNYRIPEPAGLQNQIAGLDGKVTVELKPVPGTRILYSVDGLQRDGSSKTYDGPVNLVLRPGERVDLKTVVVNSVGRESVVYAATLLRKYLLEPAELKQKRSGVNYRFIPSGTEKDKRVVIGESRSILLPQFASQADLKQAFTIIYDGYFNAPTDGIYEFQIVSTWDASLTIGGQTLIDDTGTAAARTRSNVVPLKAGLHKLSFTYNHRGGDAELRLRSGIKGQGLTQLWGSELVH